MKIKGTALVALPLFIKKKFGPAGLEKWLSALSPSIKKTYSERNKPYEWYPLEDVYLEPVRKMCDLFYAGNLHGAWELGRFDAENALNTVYRLFLMLGSPQYLIKKASTLFPTYYQGSQVEILDLSKGKSRLRISNYGQMNKVNENTIGGWIERGMELSGAKNIKLSFVAAKVDGQDVVDIFGSWE